jgi:acyl carrier protein phosphodiesterase
MNILAHFYCSHKDHPASNDGVVVGNFIGDFVRGSRFEGLDASLVRGVRLHRAIDQFTDTHHVPRKSAERLKVEFGRYSPVIVDVLYDHLLALEWQQFSPTPLPVFAEQIYDICKKNLHRMPDRVQSFVPHMIEHNWLVNYGTRYGMERSLEGLSRRAKYGSGFELALRTFEAELDAFREDFMAFFPALQRASLDALEASAENAS